MVDRRQEHPANHEELIDWLDENDWMMGSVRQAALESMSACLY